MEHVPSSHGRRVRAVAALARARVTRHAAGQLRERVRGTLARWAAIGTELRTGWERVLARIGARMRRARELRRGHGRVRVASVRDMAGVQAPTPSELAGARVAWSDPVTPTAADRVGPRRLFDSVDRWARGGPVVYPDSPGPIHGDSDVTSPESGRRGMSSKMIYIDETHHHTTPTTIDAETLARIDADTEATIRRLRRDY